MKIERAASFRNLDGTGTTYFSTRAGVVPGAAGPELLMLMQEITGSDYFHPIVETRSVDKGLSWSTPVPVPGLGRIPVTATIEEGICDVVPQYDPQTQTVLALGATVLYEGGHLFDSYGDWTATRERHQRRIGYQIRDARGQWLPDRKVLRYGLFDNCSGYSCGCAQYLWDTEGTVLIPVTYGVWGVKNRAVTVLRCRYDGREVTPLGHGTVLELAVGRGLLEPSLVRFGGRVLLTLRAEDGHGHVTTSSDGLAYDAIRPWCWDDGEPIGMSTTQQRWLAHRDRLYLVYTRKAEDNQHVMRWRAPLFIAEVDVSALCLIRASEQVVFARTGTTAAEAEHLGNFHATRIDDAHSIITVGTILPDQAWHGQTLTALLT